VWRLLSEWLVEEGDNANNRFTVAARLNQRVCGGAAPFWGCPERFSGAFLGARHHRRHDGIGLAEQRLADARARGPQPVWKLYGNGSAGSQALTGIPIVQWLRRRFDGAAAIWPFETGLAAPPRCRGQIVFAEIYPSLVPPRVRNGEVKDAAQVRTIARHFAALDDAGGLGALFSGPPDLTPAERRRIEREESWILGVTGEDTRPTPPMISTRYDYLRDPDAIYRESFTRIRGEADLSALPEALHALALRLAHAAGDASILRDLVWSEGAVAAGRVALAQGAPILADSAMVKAGIIARHLPRKNKLLCMIGDKRVPALAKRLGTTRSAAAVELWRPTLSGAIVAIGNAPTALFHLLEMIAAGAPKPALVLGFPVGFVGAAEAKAALAENDVGLPFIALSGRRGGSALAAAAINALCGKES
jgi:precorrin-8X/cobalt-precorrin-8 methylmutase